MAERFPLCTDLHNSSSLPGHFRQLFSRHWLFVRGIHRSTVDSHHKASAAELSKESIRWWFETPSTWIWRQRNVIHSPNVVNRAPCHVNHFSMVTCATWLLNVWIVRYNDDLVYYYWYHPIVHRIVPRGYFINAHECFFLDHFPPFCLNLSFNHIRKWK